MSFARPEWLLLLWALPAFAALFWGAARARRRSLARFADPERLKELAPKICPARAAAKAVLFLAGFGLAVAALAGPRFGYRWEEVRRKGVDIVIALDVSRSMLAQDVKPDRLQRAKREIEDLLGMLKGDRAALVVFAGAAFVQCPLTLDTASLDLFLRHLGPDDLPVGGTDLAGAVQASLSAFEKDSHTDKAIILITDGAPTTGDAMELAREAEKRGVRIFCIGVGSLEGAPAPAKGGGFIRDEKGGVLLAKLDENALKRMAAQTGGRYVRSVAGDMDLDEIYRQDILKTMEAKTLKEGRRKVLEDRFQWFLAPAVLLLLADLFIGRGRRAAAILLAVALCCAPATARADGDPVKAYKAGAYPEALDGLLRMQVEHPEDARVAYNLGNVYYRLGKFDQASRNFKLANRTGEAPLRAKALYNLGNARYRAKDLNGAVSAYQEALSLDPQDKEARANLEFVQQRKQQPPQQGGQAQQQKQGRDKKNDQGEDRNKDKSGQPPQQGDQQQKQDRPQQDRRRQGDRNQDQGQSEDQGRRPDRQQDQGGSQPQAQQGQGETPPAPQPDKDWERGGEPKQASEQTAGKPMDAADKAMARRILDRLDDKPGKVLAPAYEKRKVEKDW
ncbi:MAG: VWA domain-containing protein [Desulfovibrionaceae bacterium]